MNIYIKNEFCRFYTNFDRHIFFIKIDNAKYLFKILELFRSHS